MSRKSLITEGMYQMNVYHSLFMSSGQLSIYVPKSLPPMFLALPHTFVRHTHHFFVHIHSIQ